MAMERNAAQGLTAGGFAAEATPDPHGSHSAFTQFCAWLAEQGLQPGARLPAERDLAELLGVSRGEVRKALAVMEKRGEVWRHVGKGTFVGARPIAELVSVAEIAAQTNPADVMRARLAIEPPLAREAARQATGDDVAGMELCLLEARRATTWRQYESWDNRLHRAVAQAARNALLLAIFDTVNAVRRTVVWGRLRHDIAHPPADHHSFADHEAIVAAIRDRDLARSATEMRQHLLNVEAHLLGS